MIKKQSYLTGETRLAWMMVFPALITIFAFAICPLLWTFWESLHLHELRMPWLGRPFIGLSNYIEISNDTRFWQSILHTGFFSVASISLELILGIILAITLKELRYWKNIFRTIVLIPWALPTIVAGLLCSFMFDSRVGVINSMLSDLGLQSEAFVWFIHSSAAWIPIILADVWKTTPFVSLIILASLHTIDESLYEAARIDGASKWQQFKHITLPLLKPILLVIVIFRTLDAFRVFDLIYILTQGGPGTATEPVALYTFSTILNNLRFGYGSALSVLIFLFSLIFSILFIRLSGARAK